MKEDMQAVLNYKADLEAMVEEQTRHITTASRKVLQLEEVMRTKDSDLEQKENALRRASESAADSKKKLVQLEVKLKQLTQATIKDLKMELRQRNTEVATLKDMLKSQTSSLKAKDIDISRLNKRLQKMERLSEVNKNLEQQYKGGRGEPAYAEQLPEVKQPQLYSNQVQEQVNSELLQIQSKPKPPPRLRNGGFSSLQQQREWEEAVELDRILEEERRMQQMQVF
mmetsp:Transcript_17993/g.30632  ORF Transcript_17993/g.30632 Transcript_17993/m.30632 type:complete len:226 (-) Transcript_17993:145-822(-)